MLITLAILLALIPIIAVLYPFYRTRSENEYLEDEADPKEELARRWDAALSGLKTAELERAIGNLTEKDYAWLRNQYVTDAAKIMKAMELEAEQEQDLLVSIETQIRQIRYRVLGPNGVEPATTCPNCAFGMDQTLDDCPNCGLPLVDEKPDSAAPVPPVSEGVGE